MKFLKRANSGSSRPSLVYYKDHIGQWRWGKETDLPEEGHRYILKKDSLSGLWVLGVHGQRAPLTEAALKREDAALKADHEEAYKLLGDLQLFDAVTRFKNSYRRITGNPLKTVDVFFDPSSRQALLKEAQMACEEAYKEADLEAPVSSEIDKNLAELKKAETDIQRCFPEDPAEDIFWYAKVAALLTAGVVATGWYFGALNPLSWVGLASSSSSDPTSSGARLFRRNPTEDPGTAAPPVGQTEDPGTAAPPGNQTEVDPPVDIPGSNHTDGGEQAHQHNFGGGDVDNTQYWVVAAAGGSVITVGLFILGLVARYWGGMPEENDEGVQGLPVPRNRQELRQLMETMEMQALDSANTTCPNLADTIKGAGVNLRQIDPQVAMARFKQWIDEKMQAKYGEDGVMPAVSVINLNGGHDALVRVVADFAGGGTLAQQISNLKALGFLNDDFSIPEDGAAEEADAARGALDEARAAFIRQLSEEVLIPCQRGIPLGMTADLFRVANYTHPSAQRFNDKALKALMKDINGAKQSMDRSEKSAFDSGIMKSKPEWARDLVLTPAQKITWLFLTSPEAVFRLEKLVYLGSGPGNRKVNGFYPANTILGAFRELCEKYMAPAVGEEDSDGEAAAYVLGNPVARVEPGEALAMHDLGSGVRSPGQVEGLSASRAETRLDEVTLSLLSEED